VDRPVCGRFRSIAVRRLINIEHRPLDRPALQHIL
jgi:hypothetical protein